MVNQKKGLIFDIQSYSVHDGPGCRTLVFLSGCPLKCEWCANPEGINQKEKIMFTQAKCRHNQGCVRCQKVCPHAAVSFDENDDLVLDWDKCRKCDTFECSDACFHEALTICGKLYAVEELMQILRRDRQYWQGGGVTFGGGDPTFQKDFLIEVLKKCREEYIHTAIETAAFIKTEDFLEIMDYIEFAFIDLKNMDSKKHKEKVGVPNELILKNIEALAKSNWSGRLVLRMPVIENYNDSDENIKSIIKFMKKLDLFEINILPFHRMGDSKYTQLGKIYAYSEKETTPREKLEKIQELFLDNNIACYIGHETPF